MKYRLFFIVSCFIAFVSCNKDKDENQTPETSIPIINTDPMRYLTQTTVIGGGRVSNDGGESVITRGVCWSTNPNPTISDNKTTDGAGIGSFVSSIYGLTANTTYYLKAYATNSIGTGYGSEVSFTTQPLPLNFVVDADGNVYRVTTIGNQVWMSENLKTIRYRDGTPIPQIYNDGEWSHMITDGYCWYFNDKVGYGLTFGALYNWYAVNSCKLCPNGWHVPTDEDWTTLVEYLGGDAIAGGKLKDSSVYGATNETEFHALLGGIRFMSGSNSDLWGNGYYWSSTESITTNTNNAWSRLIMSAYASVNRNIMDKRSGMSVRCVKD